MKSGRVKTIGLAFVAVFALSAVAASAASAAKPEFLGPFPNKFTSTSGKGILETVNGKKVECESDTNEGELTSAKKDNVIVKFKGCKGLGGGACHSTIPLGGPGEIITNKLLSTLGYIDKATKEVGIALEPEAKKGLFTTIVCLVGEIEIPVEVKGSVIGVVTPINTLTKTFTLEFKQSKGVQAVQNLEEKSKDTLETSINKGVFEESGEETTDTLVTEKATELVA